MIKGKFAVSLILLLSFCLLANLFCISNVCADSLDDLIRSWQWHTTDWTTGAFGQTEMTGAWGPDWGIGEQGYMYEYNDPTSGTYISYKVEGMGQGMGGMFAGYGGRYSPSTASAYGPYWMGQEPDVQWTPGYDTQGSMSGSTWGPNTSYYSARANPMYSLMSGLSNMFGGGTGYGGTGYGGTGYGGTGYGGTGYGYGGTGGTWYTGGNYYPGGSYWGAYPQGGYQTRLY